MSNAVVSNSFQSFASQDVMLNDDQFSDVLNFFRPEELALLEKVCTSWKRFINDTEQWKKQCQYRLNIPSNIDPSSFLPAGWNYKKGALLASTKVFDGRMYQYYLGADVGPAPPIPEEISLKRGVEPDPCDQTQTIGRNYIWIYCPKGFTFEKPPFDLDKPDDPNDEEAPMLIQKEAEKSEDERVLTVPNTINNIGEIFKHPKNGNPSEYQYIWKAIADQHGNKRSPTGWVCMREDAIGRNQPFPKQQEAAKKAGVVIPPLLHRIIFNFLKHVSSGRAYTYPDGRHPWTYARTSTLTRDSNGTNWSSYCGADGPSGLRVDFSIFGIFNVGAAVALPVKTQPIDSWSG